MFAQNKALTWIGRTISLLVCLLLTLSAVMKFLNTREVSENFVDKLGYPAGLITPIGVVEVACMVLYVVPQTSVLGAILLTGYLGGATATHLRVGDPFFGPVLIGIFVWLGLFLRNPQLRALIPFQKG